MRWYHFDELVLQDLDEGLLSQKHPGSICGARVLLLWVEKIVQACN